VTRKRGSGKRRSPIQTLRARLHEAEATLEAIRSGEVDAVVVSGPGGERTLAIEGATHPYHLLLNAMNDGAALLDHDGTMLFSNRRLGEIARAPVDDLRGSRFQQLVAQGEQTSFAGFLREGAGGNSAREFTIAGGDAPPTPVWITLSTVPLGAPGMTGAEAQHGPTVLMAIITDLTNRKAAEATRLGLLQRLISAEDEERRRIARELHDETGQALTALLVGLRLIEEQAITVDVLSAARRLRGVAAQTMDNVGRLARGLHPSVLDDLGLAAAARRHVSDYAESFGITVDLRLESIVSHPVPPLAATTIYRILQEALTNVARHARARAVEVELKLEETMLELVVRDDGVGFDVRAALSEASGLGLHSMRERLVLLGGALKIQSRSGRGTVVWARIPAPPDNPGAGPGVSAPRRDSQPCPQSKY
jgi:signal transduction histidine kinase